MLIEKYHKLTPNTFNTNPQVPLFLNRYLNKRERLASFAAHSLNIAEPGNRFFPNIKRLSLQPPYPRAQTIAGCPTMMLRGVQSTSNMNNDHFAFIVVQNLHKFFPTETVSMFDFEKFLDVFRSFGNVIDSIYFPILINERARDKGKEQEMEKDKVKERIVPSLTDKSFKVSDFGYIRFRHNLNLNENTLRILYYLNGLTWLEFKTIDIHCLPQLMDFEVEQEGKNSKMRRESANSEAEGSSNETSEASEVNDGNDSESVNGSATDTGISITIAQHKHNHYLFSLANQSYLTCNILHVAGAKPLQVINVNPPNPMYTINSFLRAVNYQETNLYVNNLPQIFHNDDVTWESFWLQFGSIKSAKIIKPQFYAQQGKECSESFSGTGASTNTISSKTNTAVGGDNEVKDIPDDLKKPGKIGFVFYKTFKMSIRAILATNNKVVQMRQHHFAPIVIQSSFAIQKSSPHVTSNIDSSSSSVAAAAAVAPNHFANNDFLNTYSKAQVTPYLNYMGSPTGPFFPLPASAPPSVTVETFNSNKRDEARANANANANVNMIASQAYYTFQPMMHYYYGYPSPYMYGAAPLQCVNSAPASTTSTMVKSPAPFSPSYSGKFTNGMSPSAPQVSPIAMAFHSGMLPVNGGPVGQAIDPKPNAKTNAKNIAKNISDTRARGRGYNHGQFAQYVVQ